MHDYGCSVISAVELFKEDAATFVVRALWVMVISAVESFEEDAATSCCTCSSDHGRRNAARPCRTFFSDHGTTKLCSWLRNGASVW